MAVDEEEVPRREATEISMNALSGAFNGQTLRLMGYVNGKETTILIDNGSTTNFIQESITKHLGLEVEKISSFQVFVGSDESIACGGVCRKVRLFMQNISVVEDLFV